MWCLEQYLGKVIELQLSGNVRHIGTLVDSGLDIIVIHDGYQFLYIPLVHVQCLDPNPKYDYTISSPTDTPIINSNNNESISFRKILNNAKGSFVELQVTGKVPIHGYVTNVLNNYFVFYSPVHKNIFISFYHLKWLIPYHQNMPPYSLSQQQLPVHPSTLTMSRSFEEQLKKLEGRLVIFDLGENPNKIGVLEKVEHDVIELICAEGDKKIWNAQHIKTVHLP